LSVGFEEGLDPDVGLDGLLPAGLGLPLGTQPTLRPLYLGLLPYFVRFHLNLTLTTPRL